MNCAQRTCVYALVGLFLCLSGSVAFGKNDNASIDTATKLQFQWHEHAKLTWDDFKGSVNASSDQSAAATCCSIGFKTVASANGGKPELMVYNSFYTNKSWVRSDAHIQSILDHEQGHFDLCEIYTRKLKNRVNNFDMSSPDAKQQLMVIYVEINNEYEQRQQAYERETIHGTDLARQKKWQDTIAAELM